MRGAQASYRVRLAATLVLCLLAALATFWLEELLKSGPAFGTPPLKRGSLDYYVDDFHAVHIAETGVADYRLTGTRMEHYPHEDAYLIDNPFMQYFDGSNPTVATQSRQGRIDHDQTQFHLMGDVSVDRTASAVQQAAQLTTQYLLVRPGTHTMQTDVPVRITQNQSVMTGTGLVANDQTGEFQLLSNVQAHLVQLPHKKERQP